MIVLNWDPKHFHTVNILCCDPKYFLILIVLSWDPHPGDQLGRPDWHVCPEDGLEGELADLDHDAEIDVDVGIDDGFGVDGHVRPQDGLGREQKHGNL